MFYKEVMGHLSRRYVNDALIGRADEKNWNFKKISRKLLDASQKLCYLNLTSAGSNI